MRHNVDMTAGTVIEALADPVRRQVVTLLSSGPRRAGELAAEAGMSAPAMSRHLRVLLAALVIEDERLDQDARPQPEHPRPRVLIQPFVLDYQGREENPQMPAHRGR